MKNKVELLSPVGSYESLLASIENGADAVYLGGKLFNARKYATNFDDKELEEAVKFAHQREVRVYVVVNIVLRDDELLSAIDYIHYLYNIDVDALIIQDLGLFRIMKELLPDFEIHGSTQMSINNYLGADFLNELGFKRVVLSRELSINEIREINEKTDIELEIFIHGALCVSYSGQCLMSSMIGGRSGNRGTCAQPCRMKYTIVDRKNNRSLNRKFDEKHILSLKDLNTIDDLKEILDAGVVSLKVEGRMKRPEYVATIIDKYRKAIDSIILKEKQKVSKQEKNEMAQMFNRGFTKGFLKDNFGRNIVTLDKPNNRGVLIGEVLKNDSNYTYIKLKNDLKIGDGIEIIGEEKEGRGLIVDFIEINKDIAKIKNIKSARPNDSVFKTLDKELNKEARESFTKTKVDKKYPLYMKIDLSIDKPVVLIVRDGDKEVEVKSEEKVELARKVSLTKERIIEQMEKLGDTPYRLEEIDVYVESESMVRVSVLNNLRREAIEKLIEIRSNFNKRKLVDKKDLNKKAKELFAFPRVKKNKSRKISVKVDSIKTFNKLDLSKLDRVYLNFERDLKTAIEEIKKHKKEVYVSTEKIIENSDFSNLKTLFDSIIDSIDGISVSNIGTLKFVKDNYNTKIHAGTGLNIFNSQTIKLLAENKVNSATLSPELKLSQIDKISKYDLLDLEVIGYGYIPVMVMKHCPMSVIKNCSSLDNCESCELKEGYGLVDRKNMIFDFKRNKNSTIIYNSQPIVIPEHLDKIYDSHIDIVRLNFTKEGNIEEIQSLYYDFANGNISFEEVEGRVNDLKTKEGITKGHFFRGVL